RAAYRADAAARRPRGAPRARAHARRARRGRGSARGARGAVRALAGAARRARRARARAAERGARRPGHQGVRRAARRARAQRRAAAARGAVVSSARETPLMRQYLALKAQVPDALLFFRMGDFYELFFEDAELAAPLLDIALTSRDKGKPDATPMCGVPVHGGEGYVKQLVGLGHRVAICEQVEDASQAAGRRLVRREVVEVVTPGLAGDADGFEATREVTLLALAADEAEL